MATNQTAAAPEDECEIALEAAVGVALDHCQGEEELRRVLSRTLGVEPDRNCDRALREGLDSETCSDFAGLRQWVACRSHQLLNDENMAFREAMEEAWSEAHDECNMSGAIV